MLNFYMTNLFRTVPTFINHNFRLSDYISVDNIDNLISKLRRETSEKYSKWAITEYATAFWLHTVCGFPDVIPNKDEYFTDLDYKDPKYCNFHVKFVDMDSKTIHGMVNKNNRNEGILYNKAVIENDVVIFGKYDFDTTDVKIVGTVPVKLIQWEEPFMERMIGIKTVVNYETVLSNPNIFRFNEFSLHIRKEPSMPTNNKMSLFDLIKR